MTAPLLAVWRNRALTRHVNADVEALFSRREAQTTISQYAVYITCYYFNRGGKGCIGTVFDALNAHLEERCLERLGRL